MMLKHLFLLLPLLHFSLISSADVATKAVQKNKGKVVLIDFWASWCGPCKKSFPWMNEIQEKYSKQGLKIIAVNLDTERELADKFLKSSPANFEVLFDPKGVSAEKFNVQAMPSSYLYDKTGKQRTKHFGFLEREKEMYEKEILDLLKEKK